MNGMRQVLGLGKDFVRAADDALTFVTAHPDIFPAFHRGLRRVLLRRFPYAVYYRASSPDIEVVAIFHTAMDPRRLTDRS